MRSSVLSRIPLSSPRRATMAISLALAVALMIVAGCSSGGPSVVGKPTPTCSHIADCDVMIPPCGPAVTPEQNNYGVWYNDLPVPRNIAQLVGFHPLLPTWLPLGASWYKLIIVAPDSQMPNSAPLLYAGYGSWGPRFIPGSAAVDHNSILAFEEATGPLDLLTGLIGDNQHLRVVEQHTIAVNGQPAIMAHLGAASGTDISPYITELLWHKGTLTLRLFGSVKTDAVIYVYNPNYPGLGIDLAEPGLGLRGPYHPGDGDTALMHIASSVTLYTGCGQ